MTEIITHINAQQKQTPWRDDAASAGNAGNSSPVSGGWFIGPWDRPTVLRVGMNAKLPRFIAIPSSL